MTNSKTHMTTGTIWLRAIISILIVVVVLWALFHVNPEQYPDATLWIKSFHVISIICWMAGMFYLPRLFVYHCRAETGSKQSETFKIMERRLLRAIINPAMIASWITGLWLAWEVYALQGGWLHLKLLVVVILSGYHGLLSHGVRHFAEDRNNISEKTWRILNEVPTVLMIIAVIDVIVKPF
ncbi:protoporphyrinogen oxidase HemJ [Bartonella apis]|uniref:Protoporphyrinogen IX oxidase n=1 Tax=Bartonella apis TaxID=1686310 RepID=A0A1R0FBH4_9HYPH|nr:protoporphyrinogen oxidase HemJ [Bartonella apis]MCT6823888.1 protoporphyrinogen oxidase HemJ [Bartonella apis]OLY44353.1 putative membrane protein [Bartonella apis]